jgi:hypothetical protein
LLASDTLVQEIITSFAETPLTTCSFDFTSVLTDVTTFLSAARLIENVGVGAYLGAAHLIEDLNVLTDAASIATVEARHQTILNLFSSATPIPQAFDIPLLPQEVLAIAGAFISGCELGVTGKFLPSLALLDGTDDHYQPTHLSLLPLLAPSALEPRCNLARQPSTEAPL